MPQVTIYHDHKTVVEDGYIDNDKITIWKDLEVLNGSDEVIYTIQRLTSIEDQTSLHVVGLVLKDAFGDEYTIIYNL